MKKFLSTILAVVMVLSSMATVAFAADSDYAEGYFYVKGVYDTPYTEIGDAVSAAGADGTVIVSGTIAFNSRRAVSTDITLEGVNDATIVPTTSFGSTTSTTNWKALLNLNGDITVKNITFDGSEYGDDIDQTTDFVPLRCAEGDIILENVTITGSPRSLMIVGSSSTSATVTATGLKCDAETDKQFTDIRTLGDSYADIDVENGTFYLGANSVVNGFICEGTNGNFQNNCTSNHYELRYRAVSFLPVYSYVTATAKHYVEVYNNASLSSSDESSYINALSYNQATIETMASNVANNMANDMDTAEGLYEMLNTAVENYNISALTTARNTLKTALGK